MIRTRALFLVAVLTLASTAESAEKPFRIRVVDAETQRGIPLAEFKTVNDAVYVSDNAGQIAFLDSSLFDTDVWFGIKSHGYQAPKAAFDYEGVKLHPQAGGEATVALKRMNIAERLCRLTGAGRWHDSILLGDPVPEADHHPRGGVLGQDSIQAATYRGKQYWFWGDTNRASFPLGLFRTAGATSPLFDSKTDKLDRGLPYEYFVDKTGFARAMIPYKEHSDGVIWVGGVVVVRDSKGNEKLVTRYSRRQGLAKELEQGIAVFNDDKQIFEPVTHQSLDEHWRFIDNHPVTFKADGRDWLMWGEAAANVRVPATYEAVLDEAQYEAFTCLKSGASKDKPEVDLDEKGEPKWRWDKTAFPVTPEIEQKLVRSKQIKPEQTRLSPLGDDGQNLRLAFGTIRFNKHRNRWILLSGQHGGKSSFLGEVWYSESDSPTGPFHTAVKVVTHDKMSFYNVCHHDALDQENGRYVHFEGTYTNSFVQNLNPTPRYEYNQVLYRLDLDSKQLEPARAK